MAFALGALAPLAAQAGEGCSYGGHSVKKNDLETPPPASATKAETKKQG
jgi:hypothetical protein